MTIDTTIYDMTTLLPTLVATCFSLVVGILTPMVWIERPILSLLLDVANAKVKDENIRSVQSFIRHIAQAGIPTVVAFFGLSGTVLSLVQAWQRGFDWAASLCAVIAVLYVLYGVTNVSAVAKLMKATDPADEIKKIRAAVYRTMAFHYLGFIMFTVILLVQLMLVIGW